MQSSEARAQDEAFAGFVHRHAAFLYRIAWSLLRNAHDAEDAVQDTITRLYRTGAWRSMTDEKAYLARTCWRVALDHLARRRPLQTVVEDATVIYASTPEAEAAQAEESRRLHRLIDALPPALRQPLLLSGFEELTSREISVILSIPEGTVRTRIKRAREELRKRWYQTNERVTQSRKEDER